MPNISLNSKFSPDSACCLHVDLKKHWTTVHLQGDFLVQSQRQHDGVFDYMCFTFFFLQFNFFIDFSLHMSMHNQCANTNTAAND